MREALKHIYSNQLMLEDKSQFYYTIKPYELTNALGNIVAILQEYHFTKKGDDTEQFFCKLYKTKEGSWYDLQDGCNYTEKSLLRMLRSAIDTKENITSTHVSA